MKHTVEKITLKNGAEGLFIHVPDAMVFDYDIYFRAGEYLVNPEQWEVPHLMEHVLLGANELFPSSRDFHAEMEKNGAYSNASTGIYDITYEVECADFEWDRVFELLLQAITKPLFLKDEFASEYGNVEEELTLPEKIVSKKYDTGPIIKSFLGGKSKRKSKRKLKRKTKRKTRRK